MATIMHHRLSRLAALAAMLCLVLPGVAAADNGALDCLEQVVNGDGPSITCEFPTRMTSAERKEVERLTRGLLKDASCVIAISVERRLVEQALTATDLVLEVPPQSTHCEVVTAKKTLPIELTFSPRVVFEAGEAVEASPRMDNVTGVPKALWWPVAYWLNSASMIKEPMLKIVNAYRRHRAGRQAAAQ